jgi:hypothetical protein
VAREERDARHVERVARRGEQFDCGARHDALDALVPGHGNRPDQGRVVEAIAKRRERCAGRRGFDRTQEVARPRLRTRTQARGRRDAHPPVRIGERSRRIQRHGRRRIRPSDEPALPARDPQVLHELEVLAALDSLGDDARPARLRDVLDRPQELQLHRIARDARDEMLVRLHELGLELRPQAQAREALAQVVDRDAETHAAVKHEGLAHEGEIEGRILRELDHHARGLDAQGLEEARGARLVEALLDDELRRDVEEEESRKMASRKRAQDFLDADDVELDQAPLALRRAEELVGRLDDRALGPRTSASKPSMRASPKA